MYLHVGTGKIVRKKEIIGIFDLDKTTISPITKNFLSQSEKNGKVCSVNNDKMCIRDRYPVVPARGETGNTAPVFISKVANGACDRFFDHNFT